MLRVLYHTINRNHSIGDKPRHNYKYVNYFQEICLFTSFSFLTDAKACIVGATSVEAVVQTCFQTKKSQRFCKISRNSQKISKMFTVTFLQCSCGQMLLSVIFTSIIRIIVDPKYTISNIQKKKKANYEAAMFYFEQVFA